MTCGNHECTLKICLACYKTVILDQNELTCCNPDCKRKISLLELESMVPKKFMDEFYKSKLAKAEEVDRVKIANTLHVIENAKAVDDCMKLTINLSIKLKENEIAILKNSIRKIDAHSIATRGIQKDEIVKVKDELTELHEKSKLLKLEIADAKRAQMGAGRTGSNNYTDCGKRDCIGKVSIYNNECVLCYETTCLKCGEIRVDDSHVCDPELKKTFEFLKISSKPCPTCKIPIHKTDGCDQMWCLFCKTSFSWLTLKLSTGRIHNPHYFDYVRAHGVLEPVDEAYQNIGVDAVDINADLQIINVMFFSHNVDISRFDIYRKWYRQIVLLIDNSTQSEEVVRVNNHVKFLTEKITEQSYKMVLRKLVKKRVSGEEYARVLIAFRDSILETYQKTTAVHEVMTDYSVEMQEHAITCVKSLQSLFGYYIDATHDMESMAKIADITRKNLYHTWI